MSKAVKVIGVGDFTPEQVVSNETMARAIPGWSAGAILEKTGISERRFLCGIDPERGRPERPTQGPKSNSDMAEISLRGALEMAELPPEDLDAVFLVTCTPDRPDFNHDVMELHRRLELRADALTLMINDGCGGTPYVLDLVNKLLSSGAIKTAAVVASNFASALVDRRIYCEEVEMASGKHLSGYLSAYVFGDGAGAVVLKGTDEAAGTGVLASISGNAHEDLVIRRGGGAEEPYLLDGASGGDFGFVVNGFEVAKSYPVHMKRCLEGVGGPRLERLSNVRRYYLHQPNKRVLDRFSSLAGVDPSKLASTVQVYGNTSAAGMLVAFSEDVKRKVVTFGSGDLVCIAAVGANVHYGAQLIQL